MSLECANSQWLSNKEYLQKFNLKAVKSRIPLSGSIDLTYRCNLRCVHCYLGPQTLIQKKYKNEMNTSQLLSVIDEITEAGCLYLLLTGGDPLLRKDFYEIYSHAKKNGLLVTVFTNGTLITDKVLSLFDDLPPYIVEISLYGATASTYEKITRVTGSYGRCLQGIRKLLDHNINVRLKTILMTLNRHEFYEIEALAKNFGVKFRFDAAIFPCLNGDKTPLSLRVPPEDAIEKEFSDPYRVKQWGKYFKRTNRQSISDRLYNCGAGITGFHIDPYGNLKPCLMVRNISYKLIDNTFSNGWQNFIPKISEKKAGNIYSCNQCINQHLCGFCPAFFELENGAEDIRSEYLCEMGNHRYQQMNNYYSKDM